MTRVACRVNGVERRFDVAGPESLLEALRERLELRGTKGACTEGECGACSVLLDGDAVCSCLVMAVDADGADIVTVEGLAPAGELHPVQRALLDSGGIQCGFCTPGFVVAGAHLLEGGRWLSDAEIREGLAGNLCRCTGYGSILRAMQSLVADLG